VLLLHLRLLLLSVDCISSHLQDIIASRVELARMQLLLPVAHSV
jgi:hypothetical protein